MHYGEIGRDGFEGFGRVTTLNLTPLLALAAPQCMQAYNHSCQPLWDVCSLSVDETFIFLAPDWNQVAGRSGVQVGGTARQEV